MRGVLEFGGGIIGDSRWFCSIILMPVGYLVYDPKYLPTIKKMFITAAVFHSLIVLAKYFTGGAWDTAGDIIRFAAGRPSLIISIGCVCLLFKDTLSNMRLKDRILRGGLLVLFLSALVLGQTRTIFIMLPVAFVLIMWNLNALRLTSVLKVLVALVLVIVVGMIAVKTLLPENIQNSLYANLEVFGEVFKFDTYALLLNAEDSSLSAESINAKNQFSRSGNTYFRILAWSQIISSISEYPGGWFIGLPMGTPFYWLGTGKKIYENLLPHNDYLAIVARVGVLGFTGYFLILLRFFTTSRRFAVSTKRISDIPEGLVIFITVLIFLLFFVGINAELRAYASHFWVWLLLGFGIKILRRKGKQHFENGGLVRRILIQVCKRPVGTAKEAV
jgi:O-antigen ligase